jgi:hypothetical protein
MGNRRRSDVLDTLIDTIILNGPIKRTDIPGTAGIAMKTVDEWIGIILKIQAIPELVVEGEGRNVVFSLDIARPEETHLENAMAFFKQVNKSAIQSNGEVSDESEH